MGFLDFLTQPRLRATPQDPLSVTPYEQPQAAPADGLLSAVPERMEMGAPQQMQQMPQLEKRPSLLSDALRYMTSPQMMAAVGAGIKGMGGDSSGVEQAWRIGERDRAVASEAAKLEQAKADLAAKNAAFKAGYKSGKFDPLEYLKALGDKGDASEAFSLAAKINPQPKYIEGPDGIYEIGEGGARRVADFPEEEPNAPSGFRWNEDGSGLELIPGYADGIGQVSGIRRDAVTSRPMPTRARAGGGAGGAKLPAGFILD